jgi:hypothetical protein
MPAIIRRALMIVMTSGDAHEECAEWEKRGDGCRAGRSDPTAAYVPEAVASNRCLESEAQAAGNQHSLPLPLAWFPPGLAKPSRQSG